SLFVPAPEFCVLGILGCKPIIPLFYVLLGQFDWLVFYDLIQSAQNVFAFRCFSSALVCDAARVPVLLSILRKPDFRSEWRARTALPKECSATSSRTS